jgi:hypothetical protein
MIEQVVNMKKRYQALVAKFSKADFDGYFAEYFTLHTCVTSVRWSQENDCGNFMLVASDVEFTPAYRLKHAELEKDIDIEDGLFCTIRVDNTYKTNLRELYEAVTDLRRLLEATDVLEHVFGFDVEVTATKNGVILVRWGEEE